jgi:hypothetical protein
MMVSATSGTCQECPHSAGCVISAGAALDAIDDPGVARARLDLSIAMRAFASKPPVGAEGDSVRVVASTRGVKRYMLHPEQEKLFAAMPKRVGAAVRHLFQIGWFDYAKAELRAGRNPGDAGWKGVFGSLLVKGECTRGQLQEALQAQGLSPGSAKVQASIAVSVFEFGGLVQTMGSKITLRGNA